MQSVFIAGSTSIKVLPKQFSDRLRDLVSSGLEILLGDGDGAEKAVQEELAASGASAVVIYCTKWPGRNNVGRWPIQIVNRSAVKGNDTDAAPATTIALATTADFGLMLWDGRSASVILSALELTKQNKKSVVFVQSIGAFFAVKGPSDLVTMLDQLPKATRVRAEAKFALSAAISALEQRER